MSGQSDPFGERAPRLRRRWYSVLGRPVCLEADRGDLMRLAETAFAGQRRARASSRDGVTIRLRYAGAARPLRRPPPPRLFSAPGLLGCVIGAQDFACVQPDLRRACVSISGAMLEDAYHARYELLEFATLTLLARVHRLVPLHAACFGWQGRAVLVLGDSGAGKSTACLAAVSRGMQLVAEDSVFVSPGDLHAAGLNAFLHLRPQSLRFADGRLHRALREAPRILRRGGIRKIELELRRAAVALPARPLPLALVVRLSARPAATGPRARPIAPERLAATLDATQPYARGQAGWREFQARVSRLPAFELRRGHPLALIEELKELIAGQAP